MFPENSAQLYANLAAKAESKEIFADFHDRTVTYSELHLAVRQLAALFRKHQVPPRGKILIIGADNLQVSLLFLAALLDDLTPVILSPDSRAVRVQSIISRVNPNIIVVDEEFRSDWPWLDDFPAVFLNASAPRGSSAPLAALLKKFKHTTATFFPGLTAHLEPLEPRCSAQPEDMANIIFSSGTTSLPKGIVTTHGALFAHLATLSRVFGYSTGSTIFNNMALAHADGLIQGPLLALYSGARLYRPEQFAIHNLEFLLNQVYVKRVTHLITVPTILSLIERFLTATDYFEDENFETIISVAGKLDTHLWKTVQDRFKVKVCNIYGLTETVAGGLFCGPSSTTFRLGTVGKPIDMEAKIVAEDGSECEPGRAGELFLRGANVFPGYLDSPEADAEAFASDWLRTGDIAIKDGDGFYAIVGRKKAVIVSGGFNIHPDEVTEALSRHPDIAEAATTGMPDPDWGEIVMSAYCSPAPLAEQELMTHCRRYLEPHKVPKRIVHLPALPRTISGKVKIQDLQTMIRQILVEESPASARISLGDILQLASDVFKTPVDTLAADQPPSEIQGWDSLNHLNLITAAEKHYNLQFSVHEMMSVSSLARLLDIILEKTTSHAS